MLERIDKKINSRKFELVSDVDNCRSEIEIRRQSKDQEEYTKETLVNLLQRLKDDVEMIKKQVAKFEVENEKANKKLVKEKFNQTEIKEKVNQIYSKERRTEIV